MRPLFSTGSQCSVSLMILSFLFILSFSPYASTRKVEICQNCSLAGNSHISLGLALVSFFPYGKLGNKTICQTEECILAAHYLRESMNVKINPCEDFYEYACGNWPTAHPSPNLDEFKEAFDLRFKENMAEILDFLKQTNSKDEPEAVHKARKFFSLCANNASFSNTLKLKQIETILEEIGIKIPSLLSSEPEDYDYTTVIAKASRLADTNVYFQLEVEPHPFNRTVNIIGVNKAYIIDDSGTVPLRGHAKSSKSKISTKTIIELDNIINATKNKICSDDNSTFCTYLGLSPSNSTKDLTLEYILNYTKKIDEIIEKPSSYFTALYTLKEVQDITDKIAIEAKCTIPTLNWTRYIEEMFAGLDNVTLDLRNPSSIEITIEDFDFVTDMLRFIHRSENTKIIVQGLWWKVLANLLSYTDSNIFDVTDSYKTREQHCGELTSSFFDMAVSYVYTTKEKYIEAKTKIRRMFQHIRENFQKLVKEANWMDEITRKVALRKVQLMRSNIVYPSIIKTTPFLNDFYKDVRISDNFYDMVISIIQNRVTKTLNTLDQLNDREKDDGTAAPTEVNAFYVPDKNSLIIPAGIVGSSVYYRNTLHALNYGAIGSIIGHEMSHGFDNEGRRYNEVGSEEEWWESLTANSYRKRAKCFADAYDFYRKNASEITEDTILTEKTLTLAEDISDNIGFKFSLLAYKKCVAETGEEPLLTLFENFTAEQLITLAFANVWCENSTNTDLSEWENVHSPNKFRVNGALRNSYEFAKIWKCPEGSNMNPKEKCEIW